VWSDKGHCVPYCQPELQLVVVLTAGKLDYPPYRPDWQAICNTHRCEVSCHLLTTDARTLISSTPSCQPWHKCYTVNDDYMQVQCVSAAIHVPCIHVSHNKVLTVHMTITLFCETLYSFSTKGFSHIWHYFFLVTAKTASKEPASNLSWLDTPQFQFFLHILRHMKVPTLIWSLNLMFVLPTFRVQANILNIHTDCAAMLKLTANYCSSVLLILK
jgi:hypothetical protein